MSLLRWPGSDSDDDRAVTASKAKVIQLTERMRRTADELEEQISQWAVPHVGLHDPIVVDTGNGFVEAVLLDLDVTADPQGRCVLNGRLVDRRQYEQLSMPGVVIAL